MKEFISILISFVFMGIAESIDSAFNNAISIDAIVVCGSLFSIDSILRSFSNIGTHTYRTARKDETSYLILNVIVSFLLGIIVFAGRNYIVNIFVLNDIQKQLLSSILILYIGYLVLGRLANALFEMVRLKGELKLYRKSLIVYYIILIGLDTIAYLTTHNLEMLFVATMISWIISIAYMLNCLKLKMKLPDKEVIENVKKYGIPTALERLFSRIFILIYGVIASHMGTEKYSIHTVCYAVCVSLELITNAYQATLMIKIPTNESYKNQKQVIIDMKKSCYPVLILLNYIFAIGYLVIQHGSLSLVKCFPYIIFYTFGVFGLYHYENCKTLCIMQEKPKILLLGSTIGSLIRVLICLAFCKSDIALFVFGVVNFVDFYIRSVIYRIELEKIDENTECMINNNA